jgi:dTDP-4-amino-4,6-dideoxygalactose transaminase
MIRPMGVTRLGKCTWGSAEVAAVLNGIASPRGAAHARDDLNDALDDAGYQSPCFLTNKGSIALAIALAEMKAQRPDRRVVIIPAYCCPSVPNVVRAAGLQARAAPVRDDLNLDLDKLAPLLDQTVLAVVGVHMYALPLDTNRLSTLAKAAGAYVIDDAAHVIGVKAGERLMGTNGDVGLLSFNQSKTLTGGSPNGGGALLVANAELEPGIAKRYNALPEGKSRARSYLWFALRYGVEVTPRALSVYLGPLEDPVASLLGDEIKVEETMSAAASRAVTAQLKRLPNILAGRERVVSHYLEALLNDVGLAFPQTATPRYLARMMVRWQRGPNASQMRETMARLGHATRAPYPVWTDDADPTAAFVHNINATHLELPGSPALTAAQVNEAVAALKMCLNAGAHP